MGNHEETMWAVGRSAVKEDLLTEHGRRITDWVMIVMMVIMVILVISHDDYVSRQDQQMGVFDSVVSKPGQVLMSPRLFGIPISNPSCSFL